jgi:hypothetical protein
MKCFDCGWVLIEEELIAVKMLGTCPICEGGNLIK